MFCNRPSNKAHKKDQHCESTYISLLLPFGCCCYSIFRTNSKKNDQHFYMKQNQWGTKKNSLSLRLDDFFLHHHIASFPLLSAHLKSISQTIFHYYYCVCVWGFFFPIHHIQCSFFRVVRSCSSFFPPPYCHK